MNDKNGFFETQSQRQSQVGFFPVMLEEAKKQIELKYFDSIDADAGEEIAMIIAEVYCLRNGSDISIGGEKVPVDLVAEVYRKLTKEHVEYVLDNFRQASYQIKHVKSYLRTALYNSVFEITSHYANTVSKDLQK